MILSLHVFFTAESESERILKISQHLLKLWAINYRVVFYEARCTEVGTECLNVYGNRVHLTPSTLLN